MIWSPKLELQIEVSKTEIVFIAYLFFIKLSKLTVTFRIISLGLAKIILTRVYRGFFLSV
jgi:hypothetical protein